MIDPLIEIASIDLPSNPKIDYLVTFNNGNMSARLSIWNTIDNYEKNDSLRVRVNFRHSNHNHIVVCYKYIL